MSNSEIEQTGEHAPCRTDQENGCRRCSREQGLVSKYGINLCHQRFREIVHEVGFRRY